MLGTERGPLPLGLDTQCQVYIRPKSWRLLELAHEVTPQGFLKVPMQRGPVQLYWAKAFEASDYNRLHLRMRAGRGTRCKLTWSTPESPGLSAKEGLSATLFPGGESHEYVFRLDSGTSSLWADSVTCLCLTPSDEPCEVVVESAELRWEPPKRPPRATVAGETRSALFGTQKPWEVLVPEQAVFEVEMAVEPPQREAHFRVILDTPEEKGLVLLERHLDRENKADHGWHWFCHDLAGLAGQRVTFLLETDAGDGGTDGAGLWGGPKVYSRPAETWPVILISCDTARADHFSCYGYFRDTSPRLKRWREEAVLFENAIAEETWTLPSHATMLTGLHPNKHRADAHTNLSLSVRTITECLAESGYLTAGFTGSDLWFYEWRGLAQGFDCYAIPLIEHVRDIFTTEERVNDWLAARRQTNFFLFFHNMDIHSKPSVLGYTLPYGPDREEYLRFSARLPYRPSYAGEANGQLVTANEYLRAGAKGAFDITPEEHEYAVALYDDAIRSVDHALGSLFRTLKTMGAYDKALIIVTADHGEDLGDHGGYGHWTTYEECARVPLLIKFPEGRFGGTRFEGQVQLADLYPTICEVAGLPIPEGLDGRSLLAMLEGREAPHEFAYSQRLRQRAVRTNAWKYIEDEKPPAGIRLYHLASDHHERRGFHLGSPLAARQLREEHERFYAVDSAGWHIDFQKNGKPWEGTVHCMTDGAFARKQFTTTHDDNVRKRLLREDERGLVLDLSEPEHEFILLKTVSASDKLLLEISGNKKAWCYAGQQKARAGKTLRLVLDPAQRDYPETPPTAGNSHRGPVFRVWYVPPALDASSARELDQEQREVLRSLGYLDE